MKVSTTILKKIKLPDIFVAFLAIICYIVVWFPEVLPSFVMPAYDYISSSITPRLNLTMLVAIPWCTMGFFLTSPRIQNLMDAFKDNLYVNFSILAVCVAIYLYFMIHDGDLISYAWRNLLWAPALFFAFYEIKFPEWDGYKLFRNLSVLLYMLHFILIPFTKFFPRDYYVCNYLCTLIVSAIVGFLIMKIENRKGFGWLSYSH